MPLFFLFFGLQVLPQDQFALHVPASLRGPVQNLPGILSILAEPGKPSGAVVPLGLEHFLLLRITAPPEFIIDNAALFLHVLDLFPVSGKELRYLLRRLQPFTAQQTGLGGDGIQSLQFQSHGWRKWFAWCFALWDSPQQVAIVKIEPVEVVLGQYQLHDALLLAWYRILGPPFLPVFLIPELTLVLCRQWPFINPLPDTLNLIVLPKTPQPYRLFAVYESDCGVFQLLIIPQHITQLQQDFTKPLHIAGHADGVINGFAHQLKASICPHLFGKVDAPWRFPLGMLNDRQIVLPAQLIGDLPHPVKRPFVTVKLLAILVADRVDHQMIMVSTGIEVGGDQHLEPFAPHPPGQLHPQLVAQLRGHLAGLETLDAVVG